MCVIYSGNYFTQKRLKKAQKVQGPKCMPLHTCPILTTCSSRESGDSTRTSRTSRKTMVTSGPICSSRDMVFFSEIK